MNPYFATHIIDVAGSGVYTFEQLVEEISPSPAEIVSAINFALGSTAWQGGGSGTPSWGSILGTLSSQSDLQAALDGRQPLDGDLTAIAALTGTNTIYYRSAANTWSQVTIGSGLSFLGGVLSATSTGAGDALTSNPLSQFASTTSAQLASVISDETGTGALVFSNSPALVTPSLGAATCTTINNTVIPAGVNLLFSGNIGTLVQGWNAKLQSIGGLSASADTIAYFTSFDTAALASFTETGRSIVAGTSKAAVREYLDLEYGVDVQAYSAILNTISTLTAMNGYIVRFTGASSAELVPLTEAAKTLLNDNTAAEMAETIGGTTTTGTGGLVRTTSPGLLGTPTAPTAAAGTATTQIASTSFVQTGIKNAMTPGLRSTRYYACYAAAAVTTFTLVANRLYFFPFYNPDQNTWTRIGINVTTGAAGSARLGIYNNSSGIPSGVPLLDAGTVDVSTTGEKEVVISQALSPGWYWLAVVSDVTPTLTAESINGATLLCNVGSITGAGAAVVYIYQSHTFAALPTPSGLVALNATNPPRIWMRSP